MEHIPGQVEVWEESVVIPTYGVGKPDPNPMFLEKRVYQGSSGKVYPLPVIDKIYDEKVDQTYRAVWLENDYLRVMILPELGGRVQRAYDKTNGYDFVYYNEVIKPALVGLVGPWISGGIEFNWPQHHRPSTFMPVDHTIVENPDGSKTVRVSEVDRMYGTKSMASFTLHPGRAYLEIKGQLYNPTSLPQTFLWWANPAVAVNDNTQSIFPPDVHAVMDHGKRAVSRFPIATGTYYKYDYGAGVDISRYKNIPVPTSYMAYHSDYNFVGGYDYGVEAGVLHIADHHVSPGKKQWTWGCGDFGQAWDHNLTDENGPYIELMTGMYTDNQPDFTWLKPYEEKTFTQAFMPYKKVGAVKNASLDAALGLEVENGAARVCVYATSVREDAVVRLTAGGETLLERRGRLSPTDVFEAQVDVAGRQPQELTLSLWHEGRLLLDYTPAPEKIERIPEPAQEAADPEKIASLEELLLTGLHLEQYRHATYAPDPYYLEGLRRDPDDSRLNNAYGMLLMRRGRFEEAEKHFRTAVKRLTWRNPNPYDSEPYLNLGMALRWQERYDEAFDAFYKATWTSAQQEAAFYELAAIAARRGEWAGALSFADKALVKNAHNLKARALRGMLLTRLGRKEEATAWFAENLRLDPFDYASRLLATGLRGDETTLGLMRNEPESFLGVARDLMAWGDYEGAGRVLGLLQSDGPLPAYYAAFCAARCGRDAAKALKEAGARSRAYCFPNALEDIAVLHFAMAENPGDASAPYLLGNLFYDRRRYAEARELWERSVELDPSHPTAWRNLALVYFNKDHEPQKALEALERAYALNPSDARVLLELDQLHRRAGWDPARRFAYLYAHKDVVFVRDDLTTEYATLLNLLDRPQEAYDLIMGRRFHPWEGGEGRVTTQYALSLHQLARRDLAAGRHDAAEAKLRAALVFPHNLGEGKLIGARDNDLYYDLGCALEAQGRMEEARACWEKATLGNTVPAGAMYYNDQPADLILYQGLALRKLGREDEAKARFHKLVDYGETHIFDEMRIDYFAVSLPDLLIFDDDLNARNRAHCNYLIALGSYGLGDRARAEAAYREVLALDPTHMGAHIQQMPL